MYFYRHYNQVAFSMPQRTPKRIIAVIDLGTNTFRLLIATPHRHTFFRTLYEDKIYVKLAKTGIDYIGNEAYNRAIKAMEKYSQIIKLYGATEVYAFATEGMRKANNSEQLITEVYERFGINIRRISGDMEATFIYHGVLLATHLTAQTHLIMDIGGGSTEFILANEEQMLWKQSFPLGGTVLKQIFHTKEPIPAQAITQLNDYVNQTLLPLWEAVERFGKPDVLIGTSGTFSSINKMCAAELDLKISKRQQFFPISLPTTFSLGSKLIPATEAQRLKIKGLEPERAQLIVVAYLMVELVLKKLQIQELYYSGFAIKEGVLWYVFNQPEIMQQAGEALHVGGAS